MLEHLKRHAIKADAIFFVPAFFLYIGGMALVAWNLRIFANLAEVTAPGDRVLLIIGAGHTPILRHLVQTHPAMELVEAVDYLR